MTDPKTERLDRLAIDTIRTLSIDGVQQANSGHPGAPMGMVPIHQGVEHDDLNVLCLGGRMIGPEPAVECARAILDARSTGEERHTRRLAKVLAIEAEESRAGPATPPPAGTEWTFR